MSFKIIHLKFNIGWLKFKGSKNLYHAKISQKKDTAVLSITDKKYFRAKKVTSSKQGY
jgi:hypothetical protein